MVVSFVRDMQRMGEYYLSIETAPDEKQPNKAREKKMIPALDIKSIESTDSLSFTIILHEENMDCDYDEPDFDGAGQN